MRYVIFLDKKGYKRRSLVRDSDGDERAPYGIPSGPPSFDDIDFEEIKREINNMFVDQGIFTWDDINKSPLGLQIVSTVIKRYVAGAFKDQAKRDKELRENSQK